MLDIASTVYYIVSVSAFVSAFVTFGANVLFVLVHTMDELKLTGNCLKGSRPVLSFDKVICYNSYMPELIMCGRQCMF